MLMSTVNALAIWRASQCIHLCEGGERPDSILVQYWFNNHLHRSSLLNTQQFCFESESSYQRGTQVITFHLAPILSVF